MIETAERIFEIEAFYLSANSKKSQKTGKNYFMCKFEDLVSGEIYDLYVSGEDEGLHAEITSLGGRKKPCIINLKMTSYNGEPKLFLVSVQPHQELEEQTAGMAAGL